MMLCYLILSLALGGAVMFCRTRAWVVAVSALFYAMQAALAVWIAVGGPGDDSLFFRFDAAGTLFFGLMAFVSPMAFLAGLTYLDRESTARLRLYNLFMILLCAAISGVYFADNVAVTWIFLEVTTICATGLVYHRRTARSLEATWKYLFICSTGIAVAYLGILLLSTAATDGDLSYANLARLVAAGNPLYMKIAFLFIFVGYSCKMEVFPLYTVGVDANSAAPTPASSLLSTVLVNAGFLSLLRVYRLFETSEFFPWVRHVLIAAGVVSLLIGALYIRRTNNCKRLLAYSTVENMGIVLLGLGVGGAGLLAALLHLTAHTLLKSGLFLQMGRVGKRYGTYRINRIGGYLRAEPVGAVTLILLTLLLLAFPPSPLFFSEMIVMGSMAGGGQWGLLAVMAALVCIVIYNLCNRIVKLCYKGEAPAAPASTRSVWQWIPALLALSAVVLGLWQGEAFVQLLNRIVQ